jgi:hypothetical protein
MSVPMREDGKILLAKLWMTRGSYIWETTEVVEMAFVNYFANLFAAGETTVHSTPKFVGFQ